MARSMRNALLDKEFQQPSSPFTDPLFWKDIRSNVGAVGRGAKNLPVFLAGGLGDLAYMGVNPFMQLAGQGIPPEQSFGTSEYLSKIPAVQSYLGPQEDSLPFKAGKYLTPLVAAGLPDAAELVARGAMKAAPKIGSYVDNVLDDTKPSALERALGITEDHKIAQGEGATMADILLGSGLQHGGKLDEAMHIDMPTLGEVWGKKDPSFFKGSSIGLEAGGRTEFLMNPTNKQIRDYFSRAEMKDGGVHGGVRTTKDADGNLYMWNADKGTHKQFHLGLEDALDKDIVWDQNYWKENTEQLVGEFGATEKAAIQNRDAPKFETLEDKLNWIRGKKEREIAYNQGDLDDERLIPTPASAESISTSSTSEADLLRDPGRVLRSVDESRQAPAPVPQDQPLTGLPTYATIAGKKVRVTPNASVRQIAEEYVGNAGRDYVPIKTYNQVDKDRAKRIASAYDEMAHAPTNPEVRQAYDAMINETAEQYRLLLKSGVKVEFIPPGAPDPYAASPRMAIEDVNNNNHLWVFPTREGYGQGGITAADLADNPLLAQTEFSISGEPALANDIFRAVHDIFGHVKEGTGFRWTGEENAWRSHASMYSPLARKAMTSETRGQNSWVNFGPSGDANRLASSADTAYAEQKIGLLPEWTLEEGLADTVEDLTKPIAKVLKRNDETIAQPSVDEFIGNLLSDEL